MTTKIINRIFINLTKLDTKKKSHRSIKKFKIRLSILKASKLGLLTKLRKSRKRRFSLKIRRRRRVIFNYRRRRTFYIRFSVKRKTKRYRKRGIKALRRYIKLPKLFMFIFYFKVIYDINIFLFLLLRFSFYSYKFKSKRKRKRFFGRGRYVFESLLIKTFIHEKRKNLILAFGKKKYLPYNYNISPLKVAGFTSIVRSPFYQRYKLNSLNNFNSSIKLIKNFKKSNLFLKNSITNTDFFVKLNTNNRRYNLFVFPDTRKSNLPSKINITSRQITILKQVRLRVYNFYNKKSRNYKITKFFLKLSNFSSITNWLLNWEFKLLNILLRSKISRNYSQAVSLINNGYVFVNGLVNNNVNYIVKQGDLIQLPVNTKWYLRDRLQTSFFNKFLEELDKYTRKNYLLSSRYFFRSTGLERSWLLENLRNFSKTPNYMEVDYTTLSIIILKKTINTDEVLPIYTNTFKPLTARLYNWRYFY